MQYSIVVTVLIFCAPSLNNGNKLGQTKATETLKASDDINNEIAGKEKLSMSSHEFQGNKLTEIPQGNMQEKKLEAKLQTKNLDYQEITSRDWHKSDAEERINQLETEVQGKQIIQFQDDNQAKFEKNLKTVLAEHESSVPLLWTRMKHGDQMAYKRTKSKSRGSFKQSCSRTLSKTKQALSRRFGGGRSKQFRESPSPQKPSPPIIPFFAGANRPEMTSSEIDHKHAQLLTRKNSRNLEEGEGPTSPPSPSRGRRSPPIQEYGSFLPSNGNGNGNGNGSGSDPEGLTNPQIESRIEALVRKISHQEDDEQASPGRSSINGSNQRGKLNQAERNEVLDGYENRPYAPPLVAQDLKDKVSPLSLLGVFKPSEIDAKFRQLYRKITSRTPHRNGSPNTPKTPQTPQTAP